MPIHIDHQARTLQARDSRSHPRSETARWSGPPRGSATRESRPSSPASIRRSAAQLPAGSVPDDPHRLARDHRPRRRDRPLVHTSVTLRQLFYRLVSAQVIPNSQGAYKRLSALTAEARREG